MLVLDFGGQYSQLIARRVREARVYSELVSHRLTAAEIRARNPLALILSGGPASVYAEGAPQIDTAVLELGIPTLGICYGMQLMARDLGGTVESNDVSEYGKADAELGESRALPRPAGGAGRVDEPPRLGHGASVRRARHGLVAVDADRRVRGRGRGLYAVQFHPEVVHTPDGQEILKNFLYEVAGAPPSWTPAAVIEEQVERIRAQVGTERVICGLSGGVDSAVAALLVHKAVGDQLTCVFVDHGSCARTRPSRSSRRSAATSTCRSCTFGRRSGSSTRLAGVTDPETKRKIVGEEFIRVFEEEARQARRCPLPRPGHPVLGRDRVGRRRRRRGEDQVAPQRRRPARRHEDGARRAACGCCSRTRCAVSARSSGCPSGSSGASRSPARALRSGSSATSPRSDSTSSAPPTRSCRRRSGEPGLYRDLWQSFAVLPAIKSVGVQGDERTYAYPIVIRAVTSEDAMTADWARIPYDVLETISNRIINEVPGVNRVALDLSSKPPATIEWE